MCDYTGWRNMFGIIKLFSVDVWNILKTSFFYRVSKCVILQGGGTKCLNKCSSQSVFVRM